VNDDEIASERLFVGVKKLSCCCYSVQSHYMCNITNGNVL